MKEKQKQNKGLTLAEHAMSAKVRN